MPRILDETTEAYLESVRPPADDLLLEMEAHAGEDGIPIAAREVARLQAMFARASGAEHALEIGTAIGYSTIQVARTGCHVVTLEIDPDRIATAKEYIARAGVEDRVTIHEGDALDTLSNLDGPFDLAFVDALKTEYADYFDAIVPLLPSGGTIVADNLLWSGEVPAAAEVGTGDDSTDALRRFNAEFVAHDDLDAVVTPLADGTGIGVKR